MTPLALTIPQAAEALAISPRQVYRLIDANALEAVHIGRAVRIPTDALTAYLQDLRT